MIVCGGTYREICLDPAWNRLFGSGARASVALSGLSDQVDFHTYVWDGWLADVHASMRGCGVALHASQADSAITFVYSHPLARPQWSTVSGIKTPLRAAGQNILRFGFLEGDAIVDGRNVIFDPQGETGTEGFRSNGSQAETLCVVLNEFELRCNHPDLSLSDAVARVKARDGAAAVVVKKGAEGALVFDSDDAPIVVPAYQSDRVFKIGSGDIFSAALSHYWSERGMSLADAADIASRSTAHYVATQDARLPEADRLDHGDVKSSGSGQIYLAAPFFDTGQRWLVEEAVVSLKNLGADVFSPLHDVGMGLPDKETADRDLNGLRASSAVLAILNGTDPGTIFEIGYARALSIPVVVFAQNMRPGDLTMLSGTGCELVDDFATAIYHILWTLP